MNPVKAPTRSVNPVRASLPKKKNIKSSVKESIKSDISTKKSVDTTKKSVDDLIFSLNVGSHPSSIASDYSSCKDIASTELLHNQKLGY